MGDVYPQLLEDRAHILATTRDEEERFLRTIEGGMSRFDQVAPRLVEDGAVRTSPPVIQGEEVFRLYDTFGFPPDLTELMAQERGYEIDSVAFEQALESQRNRSRSDRAARQAEARGADGWTVLDPDAPQVFVGYDGTGSDTTALAVWADDNNVGLQLRENPFYLEAGGQVSDIGTLAGEGWSLQVDGVRRVAGNVAVFGTLEGTLPEDLSSLQVAARVLGPVRHDTERNHTATHLLHAALREVLGSHVVQRGSLVAPDRLRFDFSHSAPVTNDELLRIEGIVNEGIWADHPVQTEVLPYDQAVGRGAMALFGEKYGDEVRVVEIPGVSTELCGGTHVRHTSEIGMLKVVSENGVAAGVRRVEAVTGPGAFQYFVDIESRMVRVAGLLKTTPDNADGRIQHLLDQNRELEGLLQELRKGGAAAETVVVNERVLYDGDREFVYHAVRLRARDADDVRQWGDAYLQGHAPAVAVVAAELPGDKHTLFAFVSDELIGKGIRADAVVRQVAAVVGGRGGGRPHLAQAGVVEPEHLDAALAGGKDVARSLAEGSR
jgi:alanyl-tRNA synthetase